MFCHAVCVGVFVKRLRDYSGRLGSAGLVYACADCVVCLLGLCGSGF